jgi:Putative transposase of IS4/5 family (DUF4096)
VLDGVLWILRTGAQWRALPKKYPPYQTCHRRFQQWVRSGQLDKALRGLARELHGHGLLPLEEGFLDCTFASAKRGSSRGADQLRQGDKNHGHRRCYSGAVAKKGGYLENRKQGRCPFPIHELFGCIRLLLPPAPLG